MPLPELAWTGVPAGTKSLALIIEDPDAPDPNAPKKTWAHWIPYALDTTLPDLNNPTRDRILKAIEGHIVADAGLMALIKDNSPPGAAIGRAVWDVSTFVSIG